MEISKTNNFDLIRLIAATQVVVIHSVEHLKIHFEGLSGFLISGLRNFPGVSIFFTISGFLIYRSYESNKHTIKEFYRNRILRIYPALWVCFSATLLLLFSFKILSVTNLADAKVIAWIVTQISFMQFYTPDILRSFGVGTPNGSLWTITVELQFYFLIPVIFYLAERYNSKWRGNIVLALFFLASILFYSFIKTFEDESLINKFSAVTVFPYLFNFISGIFIYRNWNFLERFLANKAIFWFLLYTLYIFLFVYKLNYYVPEYWPNFFGLIANIILSFLVISIAFTKGGLSEKILNKYDISYGVYIYHMLVVNTLVELNLKNEKYFLLLIIFTTYSLAFLSWICIEKKALARKPHFQNKQQLKIF